MGLRNICIDKTAEIEERLKDHLAVCLSSMPGTGKKTAVRMLLEKNPQVNGVYCSAEEIEDGSVLLKRKEGCGNWYLIRNPGNDGYPVTSAGLWKFIANMPQTDRILAAADGVIPEIFLEFIWNGIMAVIMPEYFWFTEVEIYRYLKEAKSRLKYREVNYVTGGWAGCIAMLVRMEKQLQDNWTARELGSRYEIRKYIQTRILDTLPDDELRMLRERAAFPMLNEELVSVLWEDPKKEIEERLFVRGAMVYVPEKSCWHVQPALRMAMETYTSAELCEKAIVWYEENGYIQEALACCWYLYDRKKYRDCLIRNYDKIVFLFYEYAGRTKEDEDIPELFYLEWMEHFLRQDKVRLQLMRVRTQTLREKIGSDCQRRNKVEEILLNIAYTDPEISTKKWMEMVNERVKPGQKLRLYFMLGESVSYLNGLRDLSELFACGKRERDAFREIWENCLDPVCAVPYRLAELEYEYQTDGPMMKNGRNLEMLPEETASSGWQEKLVKMYLAYLFIDEREIQENLRKYICEHAKKLIKEDAPACRWNARALYYLAEAKIGEKEGLMTWIRETGGDIENEMGKTRFYMAAETKINLYLGNYSRAETILENLIPYFENTHSYRWLAESLFQRAIVEKEKGETGQAMKTVARSLGISNPFRYVRIYTGYGKKGMELLKEYREWMGKTDLSVHQNKKKYKYGSVLRMPTVDWLDYIIRKAGRQKKYYLDLKEEQQNIYRVDKLTVTEQMVLQYLEKGYSNAAVSESMNIKLSTVKSHIYNIYKKLGVSTRIQAVQKARENGIL